MKDLNKVNKLTVIDFDGTAVITPLPEIGKIEYFKKTGEEWPHKGWWGQPDSLNMDIFDIKANPDVLPEYKKNMADDDTAVILLTGRMEFLSNIVEKILDTLGLKFDGYFYNTGGKTEVAKIATLNQLLSKHPNIKNIECFDDRLEHIPIFEQWGKEQCLTGRLKDFKINLV